MRTEVQIKPDQYTEGYLKCPCKRTIVGSDRGEKL